MQVGDIPALAIPFHCLFLSFSAPQPTCRQNSFLCFCRHGALPWHRPSSPVGSAVQPHYGGRAASGAVKCAHLSWSDKTLKPRARPSLTSKVCSGEKSTECIAPAAASIDWGRLVSGSHQYIVLGTDTAELLYFFARTAYRVTLETGLPVPWGPSPLEYLYTWDPALAALVLATHGLAFPWGWNGLQLGLLRWYSGQKVQSYLFGMFL